MKRKNIFRVFSVLICLAMLSPQIAYPQARPDRFAQIENIQGEVFVQLTKNGKEWVPAEVGMVLSEEDVIKTGDNANVELFFDKDAETGTMEVESDSLLRLATMTRDKASNEKKTLLDLAIGQVLIHAETLEGDSRFEVRTPTSTTGVRGTVFQVTVKEV